ncbi:glycoside hydrolase family 17 protein [Apodospora peruviana]|uniref:glucan endo-1,3-beta-D-glucosidase n=1 Tax=Apodospora peruviana TaxID=516989 RepID=A0AAE0MH20_9PEZI|nr:glycoside hydrolase family 17 protein [Apodospora peruviana]
MAQPRYSYEDEFGERQPLGAAVPSPRAPPQQYQYQQEYQQHHQPYSQQHQQHYRPQQQYPQQEQDPYTTSPSRGRPGAHPDSTFDRLRAQRRYNEERPVERGQGGPYAAGGMGANNHADSNLVSPVSPPQPPPHRGPDGENRYWGQDNSYASQRRPVPQSIVTPGADNFSDAAAGGMAGIALTVAEHNARESGLEAIQGPNYPQQAYQQPRQRQPQAAGQGYSEPGMRSPQYNAAADGGPYPSPHPSLQGLNAVAQSQGSGTPGQRTPSRSPHSFANDIYTDDPYQSYSRPQDPRLGVVDPHDILDDGDDGLAYGVRRGPRTSILSLSGSSFRSRDGAAAPVAAAGAVAGAGALGGLVGRNGSGGSYAPVHNLANSYQGSGGATDTYDAGRANYGAEKAGWEAARTSKSKGKKWRLIIIIIIAILIIAGVVLGILFGVVFKNNNRTKSSSGTVSSALSLNSDEVQALMNNPKLHKVFPGIDYTALNTQYPECIHDPPSQDNVTLDVAILSQLTNTIRLYGTDCNQTQMVLHALDVLELKDTVKVWLGVWQDDNSTTNARQLAQMWDIFDEYKDADRFKGVIVANEILFREQMTATELGSLLAEVRTNLTAKGFGHLPVATSDLGDKWTAELAAQSDYIMGNIHPFFAGTPVDQAAAWTWNFWDQKTVGFAKSDKTKNIISETGWPSQGGTHCGGAGTETCADGSVAGVTELNKFMADWVCSALNNGTEYFWFEAFDEPWKVKFNTKNQNWEDHWGLIDVDRNLKDGIEIPDCGGRTV